MRRILSWIMVICLLLSPLPAFSEGAADAEAAQEQAVPENALQIEVEYDEENAEWDGKLSARVRVIWSDADKAAEDVFVWFETRDGLKLSKGEEELALGDIEAGAAVVFGIELEFDSSCETPDYVPEPTLIITAGGSNTDYTVYTCKLDGTTEPRALVVGCDPKGKTPLATPQSVEIAEGFFSNGYYNQRKIKTVSEHNPPDFFSFLEQLLAWETDENDITYIYLNAHGVYQEGELIVIPAFEAYVPDSYRPVIQGKTYPDEQIVAFSALLTILDGGLKGKWVLIADTCFSGQMIGMGKEIVADQDRYTIVTSTDSTHQAWGFGATTFTDTLGTLTEKHADENGCVTAYDLWAYASDTFSETITFILPQIGGNEAAVLACSDPGYDDGKRLLTVIEEKLEYRTAVEMYYAYLNEWVVPEIGLAHRDDRFTGKAAMDWDAAYWAELLDVYGFSGLLSAAVCDLDKNGSMDMITLTVSPREQALIEATGVFFSVDLEMYQIEKGQVVRSDLRENILYLGEEGNGIWSSMKCWLVEYNDQLIFRSHCYSTPGMSEVGDWSCNFGCTFRDGRIVDGAPSTYQSGYELKTEDGRQYGTPSYDEDIFKHMGDGVAAIEACYSTLRGAQYNAADATSLYEYIHGYQPCRAYEPLKLTSVPLQRSRKDEVKDSIKQSVDAAMNAVGKTAYRYGVSCDKNTGEATQVIIYSEKYSYKEVDTELLREMAVAVLECPDVSVAPAVISAMKDFTFKNKSEVSQSVGSCEIRFMMSPQGTYLLVLNLNW